MQWNNNNHWANYKLGERTQNVDFFFLVCACTTPDREHKNIAQWKLVELHSST